MTRRVGFLIDPKTVRVLVPGDNVTDVYLSYVALGYEPKPVKVFEIELEGEEEE